jgi:hypothetical protein
MVFCTGKMQSWPIWNCLQIHITQTEAAAMHLHIYRDERRSGHIDLVGGGEHPWTIDLVTAIVAAMILAGFAVALAAHLVPLAH